VKIRGFRVEPGEVEAILAAHPAVRDAAVVAVNHGDGPRLVGYYVLRDAADPSTGATGTALTRALRAYLRERLPEYLVPSALLPLAELPVGPTGKLDRRALPAPQVVADPSGRNYVAPRTTIEHQFTQIWESLLDVHPVGIRDDFFELGGHSLLAVRMLAEMERLIGRRIPLAALFPDPTIERLATQVESSLHAEAEPPLVVLNPEGRQPPIVFLHGDVTGGGWYCRRLVPLLDLDAPMIVLPTLRGDAPDAPATIEAMARHHLEEVRRLQPNGPYRLVGYCAGGAIAFEMARQLERSGQGVERLVLIDSVAANARFRHFEWLLALVSWDWSPSKRLDERARLLRKLGYYSGRLRAVGRLSYEERWRWLRKQVKARLPGMEDPVDRALDPQSDDTLRAELDARPGQDVLRFQSRAARAYVPGRYRGRIDLVVAVDPRHDSEAMRSLSMSRRGWQLVASDVQVYPVASSHVGLITDQIAVLAEALRGFLPAR
jgi:thioesterase domain-containing protein